MSVLKGEGTYPILFQTSSVPVRTRTHTVYVARPDIAGEWPTVMVVGGATGLSPVIRDLCRRLARHGYAAAAPDVHAGALPPAAPDTTSSPSRRVDPAVARRVLRDVGRYLFDGPGPWATEAEGFTVIAVQEGAVHGLRAALEFDTPVVLVAPNFREPSPGLDERYRPLPAPPGALDELAGFDGPMLGLIGREDSVAPFTAVADARRLAPQALWVVYAGAGHDFHDEDAPGFEAAAAGDAFERILGFLAKESHQDLS